MKKTLLTAAAAALAVAMAAPAAFAGTPTAVSSATMAVNATVGNICDVTSTPPTALAFGTIASSLSAPINGTGTVTVSCNNSTGSYSVGLQSVNDSSGDGVGRMENTSVGGTNLYYNLYQDSAHSVKWGNTVGTDTVSGTASTTAKPITVYGQIIAGTAAAGTTPPAGANDIDPPPGSYADTVTVTVYQ